MQEQQLARFEQLSIENPLAKDLIAMARICWLTSTKDPRSGAGVWAADPKNVNDEYRIQVSFPISEWARERGDPAKIDFTKLGLFRDVYTDQNRDIAMEFDSEGNVILNFDTTRVKDGDKEIPPNTGEPEEYFYNGPIDGIDPSVTRAVKKVTERALEIFTEALI